ncbi:hypothetical protein OAK55_01400 [Akkermansiaceae bacterium]|nr:hypothetical protein [Akkermansiaceae bacterium]
MNEFHPNELDPYLLFDARDSMIGTLENPTLDLDPSKPDTLNVITATRSGTATYTDVNGNIATAAADTVRVDYVDSVPMILVEPSSENLLPYSEDFSQSVWFKNYVTLTDDYGIAPDGAKTSTRIQYTGGSSYIAESVTPATYTASAFVKGVSGEVVKFGVGANIGQGVEFTLNGQWQRIEHTGTGGTIFFSALGGNTATDFEIWGAQLETGSVATSYIPTSGGDAAARTRAADDLVISGSDFTDFYNQSEGTFYVELESKESAGASPHYMDVSDVSGSNRLTLYVSGSNRLFVRANGSLSVNNLHIGDYTQNAIQRIACSYKLNDFRGSTDGSGETTDTSSPVPVNLISLSLGQRFTNTYHLNGHIKRLIYWPYHSDSL